MKVFIAYLCFQHISTICLNPNRLEICDSILVYGSLQTDMNLLVPELSSATRFFF